MEIIRGLGKGTALADGSAHEPSHRGGAAALEIQAFIQESAASAAGSMVVVTASMFDFGQRVFLISMAGFGAAPQMA